MTIDELRRKLVSEGLSSEDAALATGIFAEYAQCAYMQGYSAGVVHWKHKDNFAARFGADDIESALNRETEA